ncbi:Uncharacterised protein [uncultured archaeon]|nr:Uncharacterised protein [uncultured archaeon]
MRNSKLLHNPAHINFHLNVCYCNSNIYVHFHVHFHI